MRRTYGSKFKLIILQNMIANAEKNYVGYATKNHILVTKFGRFLRKYRFYKIPQFINVIKRGISLISPRPERLVFVK
jgi:lipopolysaccharide/colanic/teichoic acid biosynthesis glycosyltransferase